MIPVQGVLYGKCGPSDAARGDGHPAGVRVFGNQRGYVVSVRERWVDSGFQAGKSLAV